MSGPGQRLGPLAAFAPCVAVVALTAVIGAACSAAPAASGLPTAGIGPTGSVAAPAATSAAPEGAAVATGAATVGPYGLAIDPTLLGVLPGALGDLAVAEAPDVEAPVLQDRDLPKHATGFAAAVVGDFGGSDWATVSVVRLKPASRTDAYDAAWRSDYDTAACGQAGGVASHESIRVGGRSVDHVTCGGGVDLYHVWLRDRGEIVSVTSLGPLDLGRQMVAALRP